MRRKVRKDKSGHEYWQVFADLSMGLMAMLTLVLILVLGQQQSEKEEIERQLVALRHREDLFELEKAKVEKEKADLIARSGQFATELQNLLQETFDYVSHQNAAEELVRSVFDGDCQLQLAENGVLSMKGAEGLSETAQLYGGGAFAMSHSAKTALASCRMSFERLAHCLAWTVTPDEKSRSQKLASCLGRASGGDVETGALEAAGQISRGVEALVLSGSTDSNPYADPETGKGHNSIPGLRHDRYLQRSPVSFFSNAYLGAERARQAMGNLLLQVQDRASDDYDVLPVLMSRIRVETSSFGQFQVGPQAWRDPACKEVAEDPDGICDQARRLSLNVRWKKAELRRPLQHLRLSFCERLADPTSTFSLNLAETGKDLEMARRELGCDLELKDSEP